MPNNNSSQHLAAIKPNKSGYAPVNGLKLYYEIYGTGKPLVLLHGGLGAIDMFAPILPTLSEIRQVIAVDLQGHGRTADIDRPLTVESMADDIAALLKYLNIDQADLMGYSMGGAVVIQTLIRHPEVVGKAVIVSAAYKKDGWYPEMNAGMKNIGAASAEGMKQTPMYTLYASQAPKPDDWTQLHIKMGQLLNQNYDWSEDIKKIKSPVMIVIGDADGMPPAHAAAFFALLGGGLRDGGWDGSGVTKNRLAILRGLTHYKIFASPALANTAVGFLNE
ncbi:MAG: alpha/beta hydrolase [Bacteroidetes bacterium]|nr:MAG: alpha/beta hydrolase [Bacteroidota bacterium]